MTTHKYDFAIDPKSDSAHAQVLRRVGRGKRVLELGCATGYMSRLMKDAGCAVVGVEKDAAAAEEARPWCERVIVGDLDVLDLPALLPGEAFDVAVCADVLEHLVDPVRTLRGARRLLRPEGIVIASIPNVAHVSVVAELLRGRFPYQPLGLLDEGHLRFFARQSLDAFFDRAGFVLTDVSRVVCEPEDTELDTDLRWLPPAVQEALRAGEDALTYQFVVTARPDARGGAEVLARMPRESRAVRVSRARDDGAWGAFLGRLGFLEDERARREEERGRLQERARHQDNYVNHLRQVITGLEEGLSELRHRSEAVARERDEAQAAAATERARADGLAGELEKASARAQGLERELAAVADRAQAIARELGVGSARVRGLEEELGSASARAQDLDQQLASVSSHARTLEEESGATSARAQALQEELAAAASAREGLRARLQRIESRPLFRLLRTFLERDPRR